MPVPISCWRPWWRSRSSGEGGTYCTTRALGQAVLQLLVKLISSSLHSQDTLGGIQNGTLLATHPLSRAKSFLWIIFWLYGDLSSANKVLVWSPYFTTVCRGWDYVAQVYSPTNGATNHEIMHGPRSCHHLLTLHHYHGNMSGASTRVGVLCAHFIFFSYFLSYLNPHHQRACHKGYIKEEMWLDYPQPIHQAFVL